MPHPKEQPKVILVDDGELSDVRRLLDSLAVEYREVSDVSSIGRSTVCELLISSARHALAAPIGSGDGLPCGFHVVVYDAISDGLRRLLSRSGCDVAVGRPVHPAVMRLIIAHALYAGPERRLHGRAAMSAPVRLVGRHGTSAATLIQLSEAGCGLISAAPAEVGDSLTLVLPPELTGTGPLPLPGSVMEVTAGEADEGSSLALMFEPVDPKVEQVIEAVMQGHSLGFTRSREGRRPESSANPDVREGSGVEERRGPRKLFAGRVVAAGSGDSCVMIGRDLSVGGMRIRPIQGLAVGDEFKLALYDDGGTAAMVIRAVVLRDDGWDGMVLQFQQMSPGIRRRLERLVESLPAARPEEGICSRTSGVLVSEILETG
jgi:hypothetical protein